MTTRDKQIIRELAKQYMEMASSEEQQKMNARMKATNDLKIVRPPVLLDEIPWYQMNIDDELTCICEDGGARGVERCFREAIFRRKHFKADTIFEPFWRVVMAYDSTGMGIDVEENIIRTDDYNHIVSHHYHDIMEDDESVEKIKMPTFTLRKDLDEYRMNYFIDLFGDSFPVVLSGVSYRYCAPWDVIPRWRGVEPILYDMYDNPEHLHRIMERYMAAVVAEFDFIEQNMHVDPVCPNLHCTPGYISGLAEDGWKATWFRCMAQMFSTVSPAMHYEFDVQYMIPVAKRFAYTYYGCCEPLDTKLEVINKIPNLRKIGVSPWANEDVMAEWMRGGYVYSRKPNPANVAMHTDYDLIYRETEKTVKLCIEYSCPCEFVLKDISTVSHRPENLIIWSQAVSDVLDKYYGKE